MIASLFAQVDPSMLRGGDVAADGVSDALGNAVVQVSGPSIDWLALAPLLVLLVGGLLTLTFSSFLKRREPKGLFTWTTVGIAVIAALMVLPMWARVQSWNS